MTEKSSLSHHLRPHSPGNLRFGIICNGSTLERWQAECVGHLVDNELATLNLIIVDDGSWAASRTLLKTEPRRWIYTLFRMSWFKVEPRRHVDMSSTFEGVPALHPGIITKGKFSQYFDEDSMERLRSADLDFVLRFGFNILRGEVLTAPRHGIWSFHHDDEKKYRGSPAGFWEIYLGDPVTGAILQRLTERLDGGIVLKRGYLSTVDDSYVGNIDSVYTESATWPAQVCRDILRENASYLDQAPTKTEAPVFYPPTNSQMLKFLLILSKNRLKRLFREYAKDYKWNIGVVHDSIERFADPGYEPSIQWCAPPPRGKFYADPFPLSDPSLDRDQEHILFEHFDYKQDEAEIAYARLTGDGQGAAGIEVTGISSAIQPGFHVSYPYTFSVDGQSYCVPESYKGNEIALYRAVEAPLGWEKVCTLLDDMAGVDPTLFPFRGKWWLFCTDRHWGRQYNLLVYHSQELSGPWTPHECNPVKIDVTSSRPAGTPFVVGEKLYRPAQNCSVTYGGSVVIAHVEELTEKSYRETVVHRIRPLAPYCNGLHTLSRSGGKTLVDGKRILYKFQL